MLEWLGIIFRGMLYTIAVVIMFPILLIFRIDQRIPDADDGVDLGYDDNDPGEELE